eukprot:g2278.t1
MADFEFPSHLFEDQVRAERSGDVVTVTIRNAERMNTMNANVISGVAQALQQCADDVSVAVVVLTGDGERAFCAGGDLQGGGASSGMRGAVGPNKPPPTSVGAIETLRRAMVSSELLRDSHFVSIAAVNGAAAGAGLSWACACDLRFASENALFRAGFLSAGLSGDFGGTWTLPRIVGPAKAREMYLMNEKIRGPEAKKMGLVSKVFPLRGQAFLDAVHKVANELSKAPPLALKRIKANFNDADRLSFTEHLNVEAERHARCGYHPDAAEAGAAFVGKRSPHFVGLSHAREPWKMSKL